MRATRSSTKTPATCLEPTSPDPKVKTEPASPANTTRKRKRPSDDIKPEPTTPKPKRANTKATPKSSAKSSKSASNRSKAIPDLSAGAKMAEAWISTRDAQATESPTKKAERAKANPYGLSPGQSPYPTYPHPTREECWDVHDRLSAVHGTVKAPKTVPVPSLNSSGCGEVPSVLDALIRTRLSAATNNANSSRAFQGLVSRFGILKTGVGKGSVDWNAVRLADQRDVFEAIKSGGLADVKSRDIKKILQMVYEENQARKEELAHDEQPPESSKPVDKQSEIEKASSDVISLDHLHSMDSETAFNKLIEYPGIGPKTASCVLLFCMQRPSFAVDTHVFRLTRWLGWTPSDAEVKRMAKEGKGAGSAMSSPVKGNGVKKEDEVVDMKEETDSKTQTPSKRPRGPPPVTRNSTYAHLDVLIPDELKYPLHYLFIKHGKTCPECSAKKDSKIRAEWGDKKCPIKELKVGKSGRRKVMKKEDGEVVKDEEVEEEEEDDGELSEEDGEEEDSELSVSHGG